MNWIFRWLVSPVLLLVAPAAVADLQAQGWSEVPLPGDAAELARALDLDELPHRSVLVPEIVRRLHDLPSGGAGARERVLTRVQAWLAEPASPASGRVPLPLTPAIWSTVVFRRAVPAQELLSAILSDQRAALLAYGLAALDEATLVELAARPAVLERLYERDAATFASFSAHFQLREGRVVLPGGDAAADLWASLVAAGASEPERFVRQLFGRDAGRLAYFFDTIASLDEPRRRFALGLWMADAGVRRERVNALYRAFAGAYRAEWQVHARPFTRMAFDVASVLLQVQVDADGRLLPPTAQLLWDRGFEGRDLPRDPARLLAGLDRSPAIDAVWLAALVSHPDPQRRAERLETFAFGQRVFGRAAAGDAPDVLVALRARQRFPALASTLERLAITDPALHAAAARQADRMMALGRLESGLALRGFQGALAIIVRLHRTKVVNDEDAARLVRTLVDLPLSDRGRYDGTLADWIDTMLAAAISGAGGADVEPALLAALAGTGSRSPAAEPAALIWENRAYRVDVVAAERARLSRVRERQGGPGLDAALAVSRAAGRLADPAAAADNPADLAGGAAALLEKLAASVAIEDHRRGEWPPVARLLGQLQVDLRTIRSTQDHGRLVAVGDRLREIGDALVADVLTSLAYALAIGDPDGRALLGRNVAHLHDFGLDQTDRDARQRSAWRLPEPVTAPGETWHVRGSLLGLDVGLSAFALRRIGLDGELHAPVLNGNDRRTFTDTVALLNAFELTDGDRDAIAAAIASGRARVAAATTPAALDALAAEAGVDSRRRRQLGWRLQHEPGALETAFSLAELFWLGRPSPAINLDAWGMSALPLDGCVCTVFPAPGDWQPRGGRPGVGLMARRVPDLTLRIVELLSELRLPAALAPSVLAMVTQDYVDTVTPGYLDDWLTLVAAARRLTREDLEDYASALTVGGPLIPDTDGGGAGSRP